MQDFEVVADLAASIALWVKPSNFYFWPDVQCTWVPRGPWVPREPHARVPFWIGFEARIGISMRWNRHFWVQMAIFVEIQMFLNFDFS